VQLLAAIGELAVPHYTSRVLDAVVQWAAASPGPRSWAAYEPLQHALTFVILAGILETVFTALRGLCASMVRIGQVSCTKHQVTQVVPLHRDACTETEDCTAITVHVPALQVTNHVQRRLRAQAFGVLLRRDAQWFSRRGNDPAALATRLASDCDAVARIVSVNMNVLLRNSLQAAGGLTYLFILHGQLAVVCAGTLVLICAVSLRCGLPCGGIVERDPKRRELWEVWIESTTFVSCGRA
jgi:ABC transporter transmembrane region